MPDAAKKEEKEPRRVAKVYTPSERARALEYVDKFGISKTSRMLNPAQIFLPTVRFLNIVLSLSLCGRMTRPGDSNRKVWEGSSSAQ